MLNNVLKKVQSTLKEGLNNVKMIVNNLNETRPIIAINEKKYYLDELIAEGGYALIYKIQSVSDEKFLALKKINIQSSNHKKQIKREIKIWKELSKYENIVELIDFEFTEKHAYVVMEYCEEGTLLDFVNNHEGNISEVEALLIFNQVLLGVNAMHSQKPPIAHRDLKIENILKKKRNYKICDFGSATDEIFDPTTSDEFVKEHNFQNFEKHSTLYYRAPEMCDRYGEYTVSEKVDIWSLGCVLYTMVFKEQPFMNAQKLEIINGNYNFPEEEQKLYTEKFLDLIRVMLTPNPNNRPNILQIMEWTNYWNETEKIPLSPEVEEIKKKQIKSGGLKNKSHKKKLLSAEEIEKIQSKLKEKEKKKKNYDDINELFGFSKNKDEEEQKEEQPKKSDLNDDLFAVFGNNPQNNNSSNIKRDDNNKNDKDKDDLLDMEFYEVDETQQSNNNKTNTNNNNINNDLNSIFGAPSTNNNNSTSNNQNGNIDLLFDNTNNNNNKNKANENNKNSGLDDLFKTLNLDNKEKKEANNNSSNANNSNNGMTFQMNGQDFFSNFPSSEPPKKEETKKTKEEDDLFAAFNPPNTKPKEEKKEEKQNQNTQNEDLFADFAQPTTQTKPKEEAKKQNLEDDLFAAFSQPNDKPKEEKKEEDTKKQNVENDLFAAFNQPQNKPKEEAKKESTNTNNNILEGLFSPPTQSKEEKPIEPKKEAKSNVEFDLFNFNDNKNNDTNNNTNQNNTKNNDFDLLFNLNNNENKENGGQKENGQTQPKTFNDNIIPDFSNLNNNNQNNTNNNKNQDIFAFFQ